MVLYLFAVGNETGNIIGKNADASASDPDKRDTPRLVQPGQRRLRDPQQTARLRFGHHFAHGTPLVRGER
jgi:hypothetical protein